MNSISQRGNIPLKPLIHSNIVVVGSVNCDLTTYVAGFPRPNETIMGKRAALTLGGKGLNQAVAAAKAGGSVVMVACVGDDHFGSLALAYLTANDVGVHHVYTIPNCATGTATIFVDNTAQNMIVVARGANAKLTIEHVRAAEFEIAKADMLVVQMEVPNEAVLEALTLAKKYDVPTIFNPAPASIDALELLPLTTIFTPNETEMELLTGVYPDNTENISRGVDILREAGAGVVIVTRGSEGSSIAYNKALMHQKAYKVNAVDPTGAGDVFNGVLAVALVAACKVSDGVIGAHMIESAVRRASAAAALSVMKTSAEGAAPTALEIDNFLATTLISEIAELST